MYFTTDARWRRLMDLGGVLLDGGTGGGGGGGGEDDPVKKAQYARDTAIAEADKLKKQVDQLSKQVLSEDDRKLFDQLKKDAEHAEETRKRKEGEFDSLKQQLLDKHTEELTTERTARETAEKKLRKTLISRDFAGAIDLFGASEKAKTILTPEIAEAYFGQYVDLDEHGNTVVKNLAGTVILDAKTGKPAPFVQAMTELIESLPNKNHILRGSGKTGSGSSGGDGSVDKDVDLDTLTKQANAGDPKAIAALRERRQGRGGIVSGKAWNQAAAK